jgi:hypothetical protein
VKTRRQVDPHLYKSNFGAWRSIYRGEGVRGVFFGWSPTFVGYSFQGGGKYGFYEVFKYLYGDKMFPNMNKTVVFLGASASAEFLADIALCPFEAVKVRMQTTLPPFANTMREGISKIVQKEGYAGYAIALSPVLENQVLIKIDCTKGFILSGVVKSHTPCVNSHSSNPPSTLFTLASVNPKLNTTGFNKLGFPSSVVISPVLVVLPFLILQMSWFPS